MVIDVINLPDSGVTLRPSGRLVVQERRDGSEGQLIPVFLTPLAALYFLVFKVQAVKMATIYIALI